MKTPSQNIPIEELLAHEGWLRRVVVDLVDDHQLVEDVLQDTWVAALGTSGIRHPRAWLRRVAERFASSERRTQRRRRRRELAVAREESLPSTDAMVARLHAHRRLAEAVEELAEPYRTAVLLRYFEELSPREIAWRLGMPVSTVRTHIERGLQRVRGRLGSDGDVRALAVLVLTPRLGETVAIPPPPSTGRVLDSFAGVLAMASQHKLITATVMVALLSPLALWLADSNAGAEPVEQSAFGLTPASSVPGEDPAADVAPVRVAVGGEEHGEGAVEVAEPWPELHGRVVDSFGNPVADVGLEFRPLAAETTSSALWGVYPAAAEHAIDLGPSDPLGRFVFVPKAPLGQIHAQAPWITTHYYVPGRADRGSEEATVVVAPLSNLAGRVVDEDGEPLPGVVIRPRIGPMMGFPSPIDHMRSFGVAAVTTEGDGRFEIPRAPALAGFELSFAKRGYQQVRRVDVVGRHDLVVILTEREDDNYRVRGSVVGPRGEAIRGATVLLGQEVARTGRDGRFELRTGELDDASLFGAALVGRRPAVRPDVVAELLLTGSVEDVELRIGGPALAVTGRVVDEDGKPFAGCVVCLLGGSTIRSFLTIEDFVGGRDGDLEYANGRSMKVDARSGDDGRFELSGLGERDYRMRIFDPETLTSATVLVAAGQEDIVVRLDRSSLRRFHGVVRSQGGTPLAGVHVRWSLRTFESATTTIAASGGGVRTGSNGEFELTDVPMGDAILTVSHRDLVGLDYELVDQPTDRALVLSPWSRCRVRVSIRAEGATRVAFLDQAGATLEVVRRQGSIAVAGDGGWRLENGGTPTVEVSQAARTLLILRGDRELARHPIALRGEGVESLEF